MNTKNNHIKHWNTRGRTGSITTQGYRVNTKGPRTNPIRIYEHRMIAEKKIGRKLRKNEVAHHINGNKLDNRPENIEVLTKSEHARIHALEKGLGIKIKPKKYANQYRKQLSEEEVGTLYSLLDLGFNGVEVANELEIRTSTVSKYKKDLCQY